MPYVDVPLFGDQFNNTQPTIRGNFLQIQTDFTVNHVALGLAPNSGKHNLVHFVTQAPGAVPAVGATEVALYNKVPEAPFPLTTHQELFVKIDDGAGYTINIPMTAKVFPALATGAGWSYLPSGLILKYGQATTSNGGIDPDPIGRRAVNLNAIGPVYSDVPLAYVTMKLVGPSTISVSCIASLASLLTIYSTIGGAYGSIQVNWFTIGPA